MERTSLLFFFCLAKHKKRGTKFRPGKYRKMNPKTHEESHGWGRIMGQNNIKLKSHRNTLDKKMSPSRVVGKKK